MQAAAGESAIRSFVSAIRADKFLVTPGRMVLPQVQHLVCTGQMSSCNGINSTNPYIVVSVPPPGQPYDENLPPLNFQIRQDEAIVLIGRTPPPLAYFSFRSFSVNRWIERESIRRKVFPALGDPNNMMTFNTLGKAAGDPYDRAFVVLIVSDKGTEARVRAALRAAGFPDGMINRDVISPNFTRMSSLPNGDPDAVKDDEYAGLMRFALWEYGYEEAGAEYLQNPPIAVLRLTPNPRTAKDDYSPLPVEKLRPRGTGQTELDLTWEVEALRDAIIASYPSMKADDLRPTTWLEESFVAQQKDLDVLGESRDTVYLRSEGTFPLGEGEFLMVYGVNHESTRKATYANFAVYNTCDACPNGGVNNRDFAGSALELFRGAASPPPHVENLYAWKVARDCGGDPRCTQLNNKDCPYEIEPGSQFFVGFRAYVEPATKVGPAFTEVLYDRVLRFTPTAPSISGVTVTMNGKVVDPDKLTAGTPVDVTFSLTPSTDSATVSWTASLKEEDGCARLSRSSGTWPDPASTSATVTFRLTPYPAPAMSRLTLFLNATDGKGRRSKISATSLKFN